MYNSYIIPYDNDQNENLFKDIWSFDVELSLSKITHKYT